MLVPLLTAYLVGAYGWREAYLGLGLTAFAAWPVAYFFLRDSASAGAGILLVVCRCGGILRLFVAAGVGAGPAIDDAISNEVMTGSRMGL